MNALRIVGGSIVLLAITGWVGVLFGALEHLSNTNHDLWLLVVIPPTLFYVGYLIKHIGGNKNG